jgi:threonine synthase
MRYISTRGAAEPVDFATAALKGLAPDGGLYVPEAWPHIERPAADESYAGVAARVLSAFAGDSVTPSAIARITCDAYGSFDHHSVAPLVQTGPRQFLMELHHGPTLAFKDVAMQAIGGLYDHLLSARDEKLTVLCATSGDTGGAAAAAFAGRENVRLVILHPHGRISPVQRLFMTTTGAENVLNIAVDGDFDDTQAMVKTLFADRAFADEVSLSGVNSINWTRIAAQSVYYATAQQALGGETPVRFVVPTGNFGDALAGYVAARCGLLSGLDILAAVNANATLAETFQSRTISRDRAMATLSPAMDIAVPSNLERLLFEVSGRDAGVVRGIYDSLAQSGEAALPDTVAGPLGCAGIAATSVNDADTAGEMCRTLQATGWQVCPHTAVGLAAARRRPAGDDSIDVVLATAHAAKFPETVKSVTGRDAPLPERSAALVERGEVFERMDNALDAVRDRIRRFAST